MKEITTDRIVIVGAGLGALYAALKLAPRPVVLISPEELGQGASSAWAQGGVAAAMGDGDSPKAHAEDTEKAGAGTVAPEIADLVTREARDYIHDLTQMGTPFDRTEDGGYVLSREAAHSFARVVRVKGDQAGAQLLQPVGAEAETRHHARPEVLYQHVGGADQRLQRFLAVRRFGVEDDGAFVAVEACKIPAEAVHLVALGADRVADIGFYLDHISAKVAQDLGQEGAGKHAGQIDNAVARERLAGQGSRLVGHGVRSGVLLAKGQGFG